MDKKALLTLAARLEKVPPKQFAMRYWMKFPIPQVKPNIQLGDCGTAACVAGWATKFFPKRLKYSQNCNIYPARLTPPEYYGSSRAFGEAFGLRPEEAELITGGSFETPKEAARFIRKMVKRAR